MSCCLSRLLQSGLLGLIVLVLPIQEAHSQLTDGKRTENRWHSTQKQILTGVEKIASPGAPGLLSVINRQGFVLIAGKAEGVLEPVIAAGEIADGNKGRVVVFGHDGYLKSEMLDQFNTEMFFDRVARWAGKREAGELNGTVGLIQFEEIVPFFLADGWQVRMIDGDWQQKLEKLDLVVILAGSIRDAADAAAIRKFMSRGGGVILGITGWGWEQLHPGKTIASDFPLAPILAEAGIAVTSGSGEPNDSVQKNMQVIEPDQMEMIDAGQALIRLQESRDQKKPLTSFEDKQIGATLLAAVRATKGDEKSFRKPLRELVSKQNKRMISAKEPVKQGDVVGRVAIRLEHEEALDSTPASVQADLSAHIFPGSVKKGAVKVERLLSFKPGEKGRLGTGLYAPAGGLIEIDIIDVGNEDEIRLRVGAHSDVNWHLNEWERHPEVSREWNLDADEHEHILASRFGGLIYIEVERPLTAVMKLEIKGAVEAPRYVLGETGQAEWDRLREAGAPWAELMSKYVGLVLPSESVKELKDPAPLLKLWDKLMECQEELGAIRADYRPTQWIVPDQQISAGYMHAGNPIMTLLDAVPFFSRADKLLTAKPGGITWGILHEIGHNRQRTAWTPSGLGEVTNNLFALYVYEKMLGKPSYGHPGLLTGEKRAVALKKYRESGTDFKKFQADPFLALAFFMELEESFGWEPMIRYFKQSLKDRADRTKRTDQARWDAWLIGMSQETGKNLGPYFQYWGIPVSRDAIDAVKKYAEWKPQQIKK